jgi:hypothetical protein
VKKIALVFLLALVAGCSEHRSGEPRREPERHPRVIEPPSGRVRPLPPHAIRSDGVGPYRLGAALADLLDQLPSGPRIETIDVPGVAHASLLRAEDNAIVIGAESLGKASFVAVIGADVARTESGVHVGSTRDEAVHALGAPVEDPERAHDPRMLVPSGMRNARLVLDDGGRVAALVIAADDTGRPPTPATPDDASDLLARADTDRVLAHVPGLVFAARLRDPNDGHDELVVVARAEEAQQRTWTLRTYRSEGNRLIPGIEPYPLYELNAASARWIGAELHDLDLYLELRSRADAIEVGGLLTTRIGEKLRDVVVISPVVVPRKRAKSAASEPPAPGTSDAGGEAAPPNADHRPAP